MSVSLASITAISYVLASLGVGLFLFLLEAVLGVDIPTSGAIFATVIVAVYWPARWLADELPAYPDGGTRWKIAGFMLAVMLTLSLLVDLLLASLMNRDSLIAALPGAANLPGLFTMLVYLGLLCLVIRSFLSSQLRERMKRLGRYKPDDPIERARQAGRRGGRRPSVQFARKEAEGRSAGVSNINDGRDFGSSGGNGGADGGSGQ